MKMPWTKRATSLNSAAAIVKAQETLDQTRSRWPEVREVATSLREVRERNGFAEAIEHLYETS